MAFEPAHSDELAEAHAMKPARVARLANDIAVQFPHQSDAEAAETIASHIKTFWEPRMVAELAALSHRADSGLAERAMAAARLLSGRPEPSSRDSDEEGRARTPGAGATR